MTKRGAAMLYAVILSLVSVSLVGGLVHIVSLAHKDQSREERYARARTLADLQLSVLRSAGKNNQLALPLNFNRPVPGASTQGTAIAPDPSGLVTVEQTVRVGGTDFFFRDFLALRKPTKNLYFATWAGASENFLSGWVGAANATNQPDFVAANAVGSPSGSNVLGIAGFSGRRELEGELATLLQTALSLTEEQLETYHFVAFSVADSTTPSWTNTVWEFHKGGLRSRINANANGVIQRTITVDQYRELFDLGAPQHGPNTTIRAILFNLDVATGSTTFRQAVGQMRVILQSPGGASSPLIDAAARFDAEESAVVQGLLHESGAGVGNQGSGLNINSFSTVVSRSVISAPSNAGSNAVIAPLGSGTNRYGIYHGMLTPTVSGNYRFRFRTDDGSRLWVDDVNRISAWQSQGPTNYTSGSVALQAGVPVPIWYEWWDWGGQEARHLLWEVPGSGTFVTIPDENLTPGAGTEPVGLGYWGFNNGDSTGWTLSGLRTPADGNGPLGAPSASGIVQNNFLGDVGGDNAHATLALGTVASGRVIVTFEVQILGSWETNPSNGNNGKGRDLLNLTANGNLVLSHIGGQTSNTELSTGLPLASVTRVNNWRRYRCEFNHPGGNLSLRWEKTCANGNDPINDESFVLENVMVRRKR